MSQQESDQLRLADGKARHADDGAGHGFTLHVFCSYTDPYLGKSRLSRLGAEGYCTEAYVCP